MSKVSVANAAGKFEQREQAPQRPARTESDSTEAAPWWVAAPVPEADKWWVAKPGSKSGDGVPAFVDEYFTKPIDRSPKARAHAQMVLARMAYERAAADYEALGGHRDDEA
jgi:hypothetical protein